ncbi:MAG TPA: hypothetical protein VG034_12185, partial [Acidimicrobiia bacterium]|nr:hypothetical protein [Acidimicrobiia bacterium]
GPTPTGIERREADVLKRVRWMAMGVGVAVWGQRRLKSWARSYTPPEVAARAAKRSTEMAGRKASEVRSAFAEGREAMRLREAQLREQLDPTRYPPPVHYRPRAG